MLTFRDMEDVLRLPAGTLGEEPTLEPWVDVEMVDAENVEDADCTEFEEPEADKGAKGGVKSGVKDFIGRIFGW